jgi:hypothetical protein
MADYIQVPGKFNIYFAVPGEGTYDTVFKLGENVDDLEIPLEILKAPVFGDRNGGRTGDPIEKQYLGERASCSLELTRWDPVEEQKLRKMGGILATDGTIPQSAIGALMLRDHSFRFCFAPVRDPSQFVNFPCSEIEKLQLLGGGTKHRALRIELTFHRAPSGHWSESDDVLYNSYDTGVPKTSGFYTG